MPESIFSSQAGIVPFSVAKKTSKPASLKAWYGILVSDACVEIQKVDLSQSPGELYL